MSTNTRLQYNLNGLMKGRLVVAIVTAAFGAAALWVARLSEWATPRAAAAAPVEQATPAPLPTATSPAPASTVVSPAVTIAPTPVAPVAITPAITPTVAITPEQDTSAQPLPSEQPGTETPGYDYVVRDNDTLSTIAAQAGLTVDRLVAANGLANPDYVTVGQTLHIPTNGSTLPTPVPQPSDVPADPSQITEARWIDVDLSEQRLTAYEGQMPVRTTLISTGLPATPTPEGQYRIYVMFRYDDMSGPGYYIKDVPFVMYFYQGYGLHGVTWHGNFGHPMSHGCVNLPTAEAEWLFGWAQVGTLVNIHS